MRVLVAMSGGVDSSIAALILKESGYDVIGVTLKLFSSDGESVCCGIEGIEDARRVAAEIGIPHYVWDLREVFEKRVVKNFLEEYRKGRTPNPCILCNSHIKFGALLKRGKEIKRDYIATGHYARILYDHKIKRYRLFKGKYRDESYFLYLLNQKQLSHSLFPLGELNKAEVRRMAGRLGLRVADKPSSQEICFISHNHYSFIEKRIERTPGPILDIKGKYLGKHRGIAGHTIGQRKGLGVARGKRMYIVKIDVKRNVIILGEERDVYGRTLIAENLHLITMGKFNVPIEIEAKIRYNSEPSKALLIPLDKKRVRVEFEFPQWAITPGQAVVFYRDGEVIGGATIEERIE